MFDESWQPIYCNQSVVIVCGNHFVVFICSQRPMCKLDFIFGRQKSMKRFMNGMNMIP